VIRAHLSGSRANPRLRRLTPIVRRTYPILAAGTLLQTGGCAFDLGEQATTLLSFIFQNVVTDLVFGALNVSTYGGF